MVALHNRVSSKDKKKREIRKIHTLDTHRVSWPYISLGGEKEIRRIYTLDTHTCILAVYPTAMPPCSFLIQKTLFFLSKAFHFDSTTKKNTTTSIPTRLTNPKLQFNTSSNI